MTLIFRAFLWLFLLTACAGGKGEEVEDTGEDTGSPTCPTTVADFCEFELGGPCPTFPEAVDSLRCDGHHFAEDGADDPSVIPEGDGCEMPSILCFEGGGLRTKLWFNPNEEQPLIGVSYEWAETEQCSGYGGYVSLGDIWCR